MKDEFFKKHTIIIKDKFETPFVNKNDIYQDGIVPFARDKKGILWAISGHTHMGHIGMFKGTALKDMEEVYPINVLFKNGHKGYAFNGIKYPEFISPRGSIWPFGLYICPRTNRFFVFFHNETGWAGENSQYDAYGLCKMPKGDSDFRHIGLMHSDDEGRNWVFDRWVLSGEKLGFSTTYNPENNITIGQEGEIIELGSGDFTLFDNPNDEYLYLIYNIIKFDMKKAEWVSCDAYIARSRKRDDGVMGDFVKYYNGSFTEAGNFGKESKIINNSWHNKVVYLEKEKLYLLSSTPVDINDQNKLCKDYVVFRTSKDLINWSDPITISDGDNLLGSHYNGILSYNALSNPFIVTDNKLSLIVCHNGTDVIGYDLEIAKK